MFDPKLKEALGRVQKPGRYTGGEPGSQLALLTLIGFFLARKGIINAQGRKCLTDLLINVILPANIIQSFLVEFSWDVLKSSASILVISLALQIGCVVLCALGYNWLPFARRSVYQYGTVCSNGAFLGSALVDGIWGSSGLLLSSIYLIPQRVAMWSVGVSYFLQDEKPASKEEMRADRRAVLRKTFTHPCILAVVVGMVLMASQLPLPGFLGRTVKSLSNCNMGVSMILIGAIIGSSRMGKLWDKDCFLYCLIRLGLIPAAVLLGCLLAGCGGQLLSHREIVLAVFFTAQDAGYTVTLLTSDQQSEDSAACKTFTGSGATCAAAWNAAAQTMNGQPFYGLMDLAVLPAGCNWPLAEEIAVFVLDPAVQMPIQDQTPTLYENLKALEEKQQLHCGLQTLFDNAETAAVPVSAGGEYAMLFYDTAANTARQTQSPLAAQLAAILCGQAHRLDCTLPDDLHLAAKAAADVQVLAPGSVRVNLTLRDVELKDLTPTARPDAELQVAFAAAANREFDGLITALYGINGPDADPLDLCFWLQNRYGSTQGALRAELTLHWHRPGEG